MFYKCSKCGWSKVLVEQEKNYHCRPCLAKAQKRWRKKHPEKARENRRKWSKWFRTTQRDRYNALQRRVKKPHLQAIAQKKRAMWLASGDVTRNQLIEIYESQNGKCQICGTHVGKPCFTPTRPRGFDHIIPRVRNGRHTAINIQVCCRDCNSRKSGN